MNRRGFLGAAVAAPIVFGEASINGEIVRGRQVHDPRADTQWAWTTNVRYTSLSPEQRAEIAAFLKRALEENNRFLIDQIQRGRF